MMRLSKRGLLLVALVATMSIASQAQGQSQAQTQTQAQARTEVLPPAKVDVKSLVLQDLKDMQEKFVGLAQATPADKFTWRPGPGVRSVVEVYVHVAKGNFMYPTAWKVPPPPMKEWPDINKPDKDRVIVMLNKSFLYLQAAVARIPDSELGEEKAFHGEQTPLGEILFNISVHMHEHLGQSIAYARMNGVVPPWSAKEGAESQTQKPK
jgi:uncharacterized damage-inducible protein DinB